MAKLSRSKVSDHFEGCGSEIGGLNRAMEKNVEVRHHRREALRPMGNGKMCRGFTRGAVDDQPEDPYMLHEKIFFAYTPLQVTEGT